MKKLYFLFIFLTFVLAVSAQNISGTWRGILNQRPGGYSGKYTYELILKKEGNKICGISRTYIATEVIARLNISGRLQHNFMNLVESEILEEVKPKGWVICVKNMGLLYTKKGNNEYLQGSWTGIGTDGGICSPGGIFLSRISSDTSEHPKKTFTLASTSKVITQAIHPTGVPIPINRPRITEPLKTLDIKNKAITLTLTDYGEIDDDTISVFLNKKEIIHKQRISREPIRLHIYLTEPHNELLLYAENLGKIPPNTSILKINDGLKTHKIIIQSSFQKSGAIYLNLQ